MHSLSLQSTASSSDGGIGSSLIGPGGAALMAGAPAAANTIANKQAVAGSSLYQACLNLRDRLYCVPGFGEAYLDEMIANSATSPTNPSDPLSPTANSPTSPEGAPVRKPSSDPVTQLWQCFRLGSPLCALFNTMNPEVELPVNPDANRSNANACKAQVMKFIIALKEKLGWDPDDIFTVSQLYLNDTNGFVKVVRTINRLLDVFEERGLLIETNRKSDNDDLDHPRTTAQRSFENCSQPNESTSRILKYSRTTHVLLHNTTSYHQIHSTICSVISTSLLMCRGVS